MGASVALRSRVDSAGELGRRDLLKIASTLFAHAVAARQYAQALGVDDDERVHALHEACEEERLYLRFCETHGLRHRELAVAGCH